MTRHILRLKYTNNNQNKNDCLGRAFYKLKMLFGKIKKVFIVVDVL